MERVISTFYQHRWALLFVTGICLIVSIVLLFSMPEGVFPNATFPRILVQMERGYAPLTEMETAVTRPLEDALRTVEGVRIVRSKTSRGYAEIELFFDWNVDLMQAYQLVQAKISEVRGMLPPQTDILVKRMTTSAYPIVCYALYSDARNLRQLRDMAEFVIRPQLAGVPGVYQIEVVGGERPEFWVELHPEKLALYGISPLKIERHLAQTNQVKFLGKIIDKYQIHLGFQNDLFRTAEDISNTVVGTCNNLPIKLSDLADVIPASKEEYILTTANWHRAVLLDILKHPKANGVAVEKAVDRILSQLREKLPPDIHLEKTYDEEAFVKRSIKGVTQNILIGMVMIALIVLFFLRSLRASGPIILFMPLVTVLTFLLMRLFSLSLNIMTLGGMAAALGILVDNATVVVENIIRHRSEGQSRLQAVVQASAEVIPPMIGATVTTVIVFLPLVFLTGLTGVFFKPMALTLSSAVGLSLLLAIVIIPVVAALFLPEGTKLHPGDFLSGFRKLYEGVLRFLLKYRGIVLAILAVLLGVSVFLFTRLHTGFLPDWDEGAFVLNYKAPPGTSLKETDRLLMQLEEIMKEVPIIQGYSRRTGRGIAHRHPANEGDYLVSLRENRHLTTYQVMSWLTAEAKRRIPGLYLDFVQVLPDRLKDMAGEEKTIDVMILGNDWKTLQEVSRMIYEKMKPIAGLVGLRPGEIPSEPEFDVVVDHDKATQLGFHPGEVQQLVEMALWGRVATQVKQGMRMVDVRLRYPPSYRRNLDGLIQLPILSPHGTVVPLGQIAHISVRKGEAAITHENGSLVSRVVADISGRDLGSVVADIKKVLKNIPPLYGVSVSLGGDYASQLKSFRELLFVLILSGLLIFTVLLFEFNRLWTALSIFLGTLLSLTFVVFGLWITGTAFDVSSFMGMITVLGIVVNNGILLMDFVQRYQREGRSVFEAIGLAGRVRIRPILMTNATTVAGFLPLALQIGTGGEILQPFAVAVISGLVGSVFFSLVVIPILYSLLGKNRNMEG